MSSGPTMADLRLQRRIEDEDREALEHIARALEGRVLLGPGAAPPIPGAEGEPRAEAEPMNPQVMNPQTALTLAPESLEVLLEAMPAAIGLLKGDALIYANSAFAYAFGYRSPSELMAAGGLDAILPGGAALFRDTEEDGRIGDVDAVTRSRRRLKLAFAVSTLDAAADTTLVRLIDQSDFEPEPPAVQTTAPSTTQPAAVAAPAPARQRPRAGS